MGLPGLDFFSKPKINTQYADQWFAAGKGNKDAMKQYGGSTSNAAYGNLLEMLQNQGRMDPRVMNQQLGSIQQGTQAAQAGAQARAQGSGFQNSGVNSAIQAAIGQAGQGMQADTRARDAADAYGRNQQNLGLFQGLIGNQSMDYTNMGMQQRAMDKQREMEIAKMKLAILSSAASMGMGGMGGGMAGSAGGQAPTYTGNGTGMWANPGTSGYNFNF